MYAEAMLSSTLTLRNATWKPIQTIHLITTGINELVQRNANRNARGRLVLPSTALFSISNAMAPQYGWDVQKDCCFF